MKRLITILISLVLLAPLFGMAEDQVNGMQSQYTPRAVINEGLTPLIGEWTGRGTMKDMKTNQDVPWTDKSKIQPTLGNMFLHMDSVSTTPDPTGKMFQGKGFLTYDPQKDTYILYWFDTYGFHGKFEGKKDNNVIMLNHEELTGQKMTLTYIIDNENQYRMTLQEWMPGSAEGQQILNLVYTKNNASIPQQNNKAPYTY